MEASHDGGSGCGPRVRAPGALGGTRSEDLSGGVRRAAGLRSRCGIELASAVAIFRQIESLTLGRLKVRGSAD